MNAGERRNGVIIVFESDVALLRAVFERVDHSAWLNDSFVVIVTDADDQPTLAAAIQKVEGVLSVGVKVVEHLPSRPRLGHDADHFVAMVTNKISATRAKLITTLVLVDTTLRNKLMNLDHYATAEGILPLAGVGTGRPAIVVSAGPSLDRTIDLLADPDLRERVVIIGVQTVLKPLLDRGIRPHFVTALDYHEISRRFYESLSADDVEGVTLVAETKTNPGVLDAFPGAIRCPQDPFLDDLLGPSLSRKMGALPDGATVAHLAYYLARFLGCDPVILTGQDLGFTDGQYYAAGAAIHNVWAGELNEFNTLEMMEWQRIVRGRRTLRRLVDVHARPIYTDEQMNAYLEQFEREFGADLARGLRVIDATEGGVRKRNTEVRSMRDALALHATNVTPLDLPAPSNLDRAERIPLLLDRIRRVRADVAEVAADSRRAKRLLERMLNHLDDTPKVNKLIEEVYKIDARVKSKTLAFEMVQLLDQKGVLNRYKADRAITIDDRLDPNQRQKRQIDRDIANVSGLATKADQLAELLESASAALGGGPKITRDADAPAAARSRVKATVLMCVDPDRASLGHDRPLDQPLGGAGSALRLTLERLARASRVKDGVLLTHQPDRVREMLAGFDAMPVHIEALDEDPLAGRRRAVRAARAFASHCWRGGLASFTCYDELLAPCEMRRVMDARSIDAAILVGPDWALVDPRLTDAVIQRHADNPEAYRIVFTQAPPGLAPCLVERSLMAEFADNAAGAGVFASIGATLGYVPIVPRRDPIAEPFCVIVDPVVRDAFARFIADEPASRDRVARILRTLGKDATAHDIAAFARAEPPGAASLTLQLAAGGELMSADVAGAIIAEAGGVPITLAGDDPLDHPEVFELIALARERGVVHVRTSLGAGDEVLERLISANPDIVSIDLVANTPETYTRLTGRDGHERVVASVTRLLESRSTTDAPDALPAPWIVPRITRRDDVYEEIEPFFDHWIMTAGACVIDPLAAPNDAERIAPLPMPTSLARRRARCDQIIGPNGCVSIDSHATDRAGVQFQGASHLVGAS
jgi:hypothetical protein